MALHGHSQRRPADGWPVPSSVPPTSLQLVFRAYVESAGGNYMTFRNQRYLIITTRKALGGTNR